MNNAPNLGTTIAHIQGQFHKLPFNIVLLYTLYILCTDIFAILDYLGNSRGLNFAILVMFSLL